jgi:hypothetical protein
MGVAAVVAGGLSIYWTAASSGERRPPTPGAARITIGPASAFFERTF